MGSANTWFVRLFHFGLHQVPSKGQDDRSDASLRGGRHGHLLRGASDVRPEGLLRRLVRDDALDFCAQHRIRPQQGVKWLYGEKQKKNSYVLYGEKQKNS